MPATVAKPKAKLLINFYGLVNNNAIIKAAIIELTQSIFLFNA